MTTKPTAQMHVAVAIVGYRNAEDIRECLGALEKSSYRDFEVIICENGGPDHFAKLAATLPATLANGQHVRAVLAPRNLGYAGGVNTCLRETPAADAWWVLNPDTKTTPDGLRWLVERLQRGDCDATGGPVFLDDGSVQSYGGYWHTWTGRAASIGRGAAHDSAIDENEIERRQNYLNGASMLISRRFLDVVGPMREDYFLYCEEVEWCLRARSLGMRLGFAPNGSIIHRQGTTTGGNAVGKSPSRLSIFLGERNKILMTRDLFPIHLPTVALTAIVIQFARFRRHGAWRGLRYGIQGLIGGLTDRRGTPDWLA